MELWQLGKGLSNLVTNFVEDLKPGLGDNLRSAILYGSVASGGHSRKYSDINLLLLLDKVDAADLKAVSRIKRKFRFNRIEPLVLSREYLENSTDTFPIEFLDMRDNYILLWGEDSLKDLRIDLKYLRHQCEWELKSKIIRMQQFYLSSAGRNSGLRNFLISSLPSFLVIFKNILRLKNIIEQDKDKVLERLAIEFSLNKDTLGKVCKGRFTNYKAVKLDELFGEFLSELKRLSQKIDALPGEPS